MLPIHTYNVTPNLPAALEPLREMVFNLRWTWQPDARKRFRDLDLVPRKVPPNSACSFRSRI